MTENHPITPSLELVEQWECEYHHMTYGPDLSMFISEKAARWGADLELEACCEWLLNSAVDGAKTPEPYIAAGPEAFINALRAARRPKPPSLKEQGLKALDSFEGFTGSLEEVDIIRRALEALPD